MFYKRLQEREPAAFSYTSETHPTVRWNEDSPYP